MSHYAVVSGTNVVNVVEWDGVAPWEPPAGATAILEPTGTVGPGWTYTGGAFVAPPPSPNIPPPYTPPMADANLRLNAGIDAALVAADEVRDTLHAIPAQFNAANFQQFLLQAKILADAFVAMLEAQQVQPPPPS